MHRLILVVMEGYGKPELGFRSCMGVLRLAREHDWARFDAAYPYTVEFGTTYRGLGAILRTEPVSPADEATAGAGFYRHGNWIRHRSKRIKQESSVYRLRLDGKGGGKDSAIIGRRAANCRSDWGAGMT